MPGRYIAVAIGLYSGVVVKRGSTVWPQVLLLNYITRTKGL